MDATFNREGYNTNSLVWTIEDTQVAKVNNTGLVTAGLIGETNMTVKTSDGVYSESLKVTVLPTETLFEDPILNFGESKAFIKENESRSIAEEEPESILYMGENENVRSILYFLEMQCFLDLQCY